MEYIYIIERGRNNYSAYVPDLPGCVTTGKTIDEIKKNIKEAIEFHIEGMISNGERVPKPKNYVNKVKISLPN